MAEFLFEIGLEEVPARMIATGAEQVRERVLLVLVQNRLCASGAGHTVFATPRRLAVYVTDVAERQPDAVEEVLGPSAKVAFRDGVATVAAEAFARKVDVSLSELHIVSTAKGDYVSATVKRVGKSAIEIISDQLSKELHGISWAKNMYWRPRKPERFVRPVRWMVALLGEQIVPVAFGGKTADAKTFARRVSYGDEPIA